MHRLGEGQSPQSMQCHGKPSAIPSRVLTASLVLLILMGAPAARAQSSSSSQAPAATNPGPAKSPALVDTAGPDISLQNSEALFYIAAALNSCGHDQGLGPTRCASRSASKSTRRCRLPPMRAKRTSRFALSSITTGFPIPGPIWRNISPSLSSSPRLPACPQCRRRGHASRRERGGKHPAPAAPF